MSAETITMSARERADDAAERELERLLAVEGAAAVFLLLDGELSNGYRLERKNEDRFQCHLSSLCQLMARELARTE